jgi:hypothetical protein
LEEAGALIDKGAVNATVQTGAKALKVAAAGGGLERPAPPSEPGEEKIRAHHPQLQAFGIFPGNPSDTLNPSPL